MFSYIFMKILESRPERYDRGINVVSGGHAFKVKDYIVKRHVKKDIKMLDVGCGTGALAIESARAGADVTGIDISEGMLSIAKKKIDNSSLKNSIKLYRAGVVEMDNMFARNNFDLITSTLVISELYPDERHWTFRHLHKILKPDGTLVTACEVLPKNIFKRLLYHLVRLPLAIITYIIAQTGTRPIHNFNDELINAGFEIIDEQYSFLDSFVIITAKKTANGKIAEKHFNQIKTNNDFSIVRTVWDYIGRWFPNSSEPGLRKIGGPDKNSPVLITSNFHLTVRKIERELKNVSCYLLVAPTGGINVWCGSAGGEMTEHSVISVIKTSGISELVSHRRIILPLLCASGVDTRAIKKETGFHADFGPLCSKDVPCFLKTGKLDHNNTTARFTLPFRIEMLFSMNFLLWLVIAIPLLLFSVYNAAVFSSIFWISGLLLYIVYPLIPGNSGWLKSIQAAAVVSVSIMIYQINSIHVAWLSSAGWIMATVLINLWFGFDLRGIASSGTSEAVILLNKLNIKSFGKLHKASSRELRSIYIDYNLCIKCKLCIKVCPVNVFEFDNETINLKYLKKCMKCGACVKQCPVAALSLK